MSRTDKDLPYRIRKELPEFKAKSYWERYGYFGNGVPAWFVNHVWNAPERVSSRVDCNEAKKEFNAGYEPETEPSTRQHRHCAQWLFW